MGEAREKKSLAFFDGVMGSGDEVSDDGPEPPPPAVALFDPGVPP